MRPIYNTQKNPEASTATVVKLAKELEVEEYATIEELLSSEIPADKFKQWKGKEQKERLDKTTMYSPQPHNNQSSSSTTINTSSESFYLPKAAGNKDRLPKTSTVIENQSIINGSGNCTELTLTNPNHSVNVTSDQIDCSAGSSVLSHVDTTPLFSPSQIVKLNRQRKQKSMEKDLDNIQANNQPHEQCSNVYQKLSHVKPAKAKVFDLNNNEGK